MNSILEKHTKHYAKWDFLAFTVLTTLAIANGRTTIFYVIYFFWCYELVRIIVDRAFIKTNENAIITNLKRTSIFSSLIQMGVYFIFIVVFFAFMVNWKNQDIIQTNFEILFFKNWFFNINLIFVFIERLIIHKTKQPVLVSFGLFTPNMLILHVSIIIGALLMFFVVNNFPETFTPSNLWGSVIIIIPFFIMRTIMLGFK
ncbi:hypothetical protein ACU8DI_12105 [Psychroserpens sp. BH13MA-6]